VPKRTNLFEEVVEILHRHMAGDATAEASAMLPNEATGALREVDMVIRGKQAGYELIVSVEAVGLSRKADIQWVEQMVGKHADLPTNQLVLVAQKGFGRKARALALASNAVPLAPDDLTTKNPDRAVLRAVRALWPKVFSFRPQQLTLKFADDDIPKGGWGDAMSTAVAEDDEEGVPVGDLLETTRLVYDMNFASLVRQIDLLNRTDDAEEQFTLVLFPAQGDEIQLPVDGVPKTLYLLNDNGRGYSLRWIKAVGTGTITVSKIPRTNALLGELKLNLAYGDGKVADRAALVVVPEGGDARGQLTVLIRPPHAE
jgi:hypothetical protein